MIKSDSKAFNAVIISASLIIIIAGMMAAKSILIPFLLAGFIAIIAAPSLFWFQSKGLPSGLSLLVVLLLMIGTIVMLGILVGSSVNAFTQELPVYEIKLKEQFSGISVWLASMGVDVSNEGIQNMLNPARLMQVTTTIFQGFTALLTNGMMIMFLVIFMLLEASTLPKKLNDIHIDVVGHAKEFVDDVKQYMVLKTVFSLITGVLVTVMLAALGVNYALLWGLIAFLLNFIPNIGSIIAAVPAVLLTLVQLGSTTALIVSAGFVVINIVIGSIVEPKYMGKGLGLSTLVVFLSLIFWGWVLGPVGMLLSIPLTVMIKIALATSENTRVIARLLE